MKLYDQNLVSSYREINLSKFKEITYSQLKELLKEQGIDTYRGFQGIEPKGSFARINTLDYHKPLIYILYGSFEESKYVEYLIKRDFKLNLTPVPDNYTGYVKKTSIAVSSTCKTMLDELKEDNMSYEDVIYGLMTELYYFRE